MDNCKTTTFSNEEFNTYRSLAKEHGTAYKLLMSNHFYHPYYHRFHSHRINMYTVLNSMNEEGKKRILANYIRYDLHLLNILLNHNHEYFEQYYSLCIKLITFIENKEERDGNTLMIKLITRVRNAFHNLKNNAISIISSRIILNHFCSYVDNYRVFKKKYKQQRHLIELADRAIQYNYRHRIRTIISLVQIIQLDSISDFINLVLSAFPNLFLQQQCATKVSSKIKPGILYSELAYGIFERKHKIPRPQKVYPLSIMIKKDSINGKFDFPCQTKGYIATQSNINSSPNPIVLSFRGTNLKNIGNIFTDIYQLFLGPDAAYRCALGLLLAIRKHYPNSRIDVFGHSLGGGLSQFAVAASLDKNAYAYCYNAAGLGEETFNIITKITKKSHHHNILHLYHDYDIVSKVGYQLGAYYKVSSLTKSKSLNPQWQLLVSHKIKTMIDLFFLHNKMMRLEK